MASNSAAYAVYMSCVRRKAAEHCRFMGSASRFRCLTENPQKLVGMDIGLEKSIKDYASRYLIALLNLNRH
jgi:hypothetical protein